MTFSSRSQSTNDGNVDTAVQYTIDPPIADLTQIGSWIAPVLRGYTAQQVALTIGVADSATLGARMISIHESVSYRGEPVRHQHLPTRGRID